jgi:transcriptional regulator with XRE-family HTH domain
MEKRSPFGRRVRENRLLLDLTQDELARRVGCASITVRKIEAGDMRPSKQIAELLAKALAIPFEDQAEFVREARAVKPGGAERVPTPTPQVTREEIGKEDLSGRAIRGYTLAERIGMGGFGVVYRAVQPLVDREVAVKIIMPEYADHPDFIRRFEAEAQIVARLEHPHIVPLYDYWREPAVAYLVMRLLRGGSVEGRLNDGALPLDVVAEIINQVGAALHTAHRVGIVHRDLKPANILLDEDGNAETQVGAFLGSPDGSRLVGHGDDGLMIWDTETGELLASNSGQGSLVFSIDWFPSGDRIVSFDKKGFVKVWDSVTGAELLRFEMPLTGISALSPDGTALALAQNPNGPVKVQWIWQSMDELIDYARECCVFRELTPAEREQFGLPPLKSG